MITHVSSLVVGAGGVAATGPGGSWTAVALLGLAVLAGTCVRVVGRNERAVISRSGQVTRVRGSGIAWRLPGAERLVIVSMRPVEMPLVISATSKDDVPVRVMATAVCRPCDPARWAAQASPLAPVALAVEEALQRRIARRRLLELLQDAAPVEARLAVEVNTHTATLGAQVSEIWVSDIEARLTPQLLRVLQRP